VVLGQFEIELTGSSQSQVQETVSIAEAARLLGVSWSRVYALLQRGQLESVVVAGTTRVTAASVVARQRREAPTGAPLAPSSAWAVLALAAGDPAMLTHVAGRLSAADRSRARRRLLADGLITLVPRLGRRGVVRRFAGRAEVVADLIHDPDVALGGVSAAIAHGWSMPAVEASSAFRTVDVYLGELRLAEVVGRYELEPDEAGTIVLRAVREPWPFPPQLRLAPAAVVALDLAESSVPALAEVARVRLAKLAETVEPSWHRRHSPKPPLRSPLAGARNGEAPVRTAATRRPTLAGSGGEVWDDRAAADIKHLVALLFVAASSLTRAELSRQLGIGQTRLARACELARPMLGRLGLMLIESGEELSLATCGECSAVVEKFLETSREEAVSPAALQVLAIVAYEQPVTRADITRIRAVDSNGVVA
jgi:excisionase family DNA binding protein